MSEKSKNPLRVMLLVFLVPIMIPFANDVFLPSFPEMIQYFHTDNIQLIMSIFMFGFAGSQLVYGPLSDRFGRKPTLSLGILIFIVGGILCSVAHDFHVLLFGRLIQALGATSTLMSVFAIIRDTYSAEETMKYLALVMGIIGVCPMLSPIFGSFIQAHFGWRGNMIFILLMGVLGLCIILFLFKESMKEKNRGALQPKNIIGNYRTVLSHRQYQGYALAGAFGYAAMFSYLAAAPIIIMTIFDKSITEFAILFALNASALLITAIAAPKISRMTCPSTTLYLSALLTGFGGLSMALLTLFFKPNLGDIVLPMFIMTLGIGLMRPTASSGAVKIFPATIAGSASAMYSFVSFLLSAILVCFIHSILSISISLLGAIIFGLGVLSLFAAVRSQCTNRPEAEKNSPLTVPDRL